MRNFGHGEISPATRAIGRQAAQPARCRPRAAGASLVWSFAVLGLALAGSTGGCGSKGAGTEASKSELATQCIAYQHRYWRSVGEAAGPAPDPDWDKYACTDVYSQPACAQAWRPGAAGQAVALAEACKTAYCEGLQNQPTLCRRQPATLEPGDLVRALVELDTAILTLEIGDRGLAQQLAARFRVVRKSAEASAASAGQAR